MGGTNIFVTVHWRLCPNILVLWFCVLRDAREPKDFGLRVSPSIDSRGEGLETEAINTNQRVHSVKFGAQAIHD